MEKATLSMSAAERLERIRTRQEQIGNVLKRYRRIHNVSMGEVAELLGRRRQTISQVERGRASLDLPSLEILIEVLDIPLEEIGLGASMQNSSRVRRVEVPIRPGEVLQITIDVSES